MLAVAAGCGGTSTAHHPLTNDLSPAYANLTVHTLAALPFGSDISDDEDPDKVAGSMTEAKFYAGLSSGSTFTILPSAEVQRVLDREGLTPQLKSFYKEWISDQGSADADFIKKVASLVKTDGVVVGAVDIWHQQPVDITQSGTARTSVGVLVALFDGATGKRLWLGRDENFKEALRYSPNESGSALANTQLRAETERTNLRTATGVYAPPDFSDVVDLAIAPLVTAFPKRAK
jgi:hypothetical protein